MCILNNEHFLLDSVGCNWIEKLHFLFKILNCSIHNAQKKLILFLDLKAYRDTLHAIPTNKNAFRIEKHPF